MWPARHFVRGTGRRNTSAIGRNTRLETGRFTVEIAICNKETTEEEVVADIITVAQKDFSFKKVPN